MHQGLLSLEHWHSVEKGIQCSRTAEHLCCYYLPSCKCIIIFSSITGGQSSSSSQQFIHHCWADHFISQKFIRVYRQILSSSSVIHFLSLGKSFRHQPTISSISFPSSHIFHLIPEISFSQSLTFKPAHHLSHADTDCVWAWQILFDGLQLFVSRTIPSLQTNINSYTFILSWCQYLLAQFLCLGC